MRRALKHLCSDREDGFVRGVDALRRLLGWRPVSDQLPLNALRVDEVAKIIRDGAVELRRDIELKHLKQSG